MTPARRARGFTIVELMVAVAILAILLAAGVPSMRSWMSTTKAVAASEFYAEGFRMARAEAVKRNAVTRLTLLDSTTGGQMDWQVDLCVPTPAAACTAESGSWSTATTAASGASATDFRSVKRTATTLPAPSFMTLTRYPAGAVAVYFTTLGWVDGTIAPSLNRIDLAPASGRASLFPTSSVVVTLAGVVAKCNPAAVAHDSRGCPP